MATLRDRATRRTKSVVLVAIPVLLLLAFAIATYTPMFHARNQNVSALFSISNWMPSV